MEKQDRLGMSAQRRQLEKLLLHKGMVISLVLVLSAMMVARHVPIMQRLAGTAGDDVLQALNLEVVLLKKPPPPPPPKTMQVVPPVTIQKKKDIQPKKVTRPAKPKRNPRRRFDDHKVDFSLSARSQALLADASALGSIDAPVGRSSRLDAFDGGPSLSLDAGSVVAEGGPAGISLEVDAAAVRTASAPALDEPALKLAVPEEPEKKTSQKAKKDVSAGVIDANVSVVLASTDISAGSEEYQLWNRINAEFDRWDKGRYGSFPAQLQRRGRSIVAYFAYADGTGHRIVWRRGNTKIYVQGKSKRVRLMELKQAVSAMIQLNINKSE